MHLILVAAELGEVVADFLLEKVEYRPFIHCWLFLADYP